MSEAALQSTNTGAVVITGASRGIGFAIADRLAKSGRTVVGISRGEAENGFPGRLIHADLSSRDATADVLNTIRDEFHVDTVVNNVGIANPQAIEDVDPETFAQTIDRNIGLAVRVTQAFVGKMKSTGHGRILNISSRAALGRELRTSYSAAKSGMIGMTRSWALELAAYGITANVIAPGLTDTQMMRRNNPNIESMQKNIPMKRLGHPDEIAAVAAFLVSAEASYVTGQVVHVCGGLSVGYTQL